jgi:GT2 family glycosyltransferase
VYVIDQTPNGINMNLREQYKNLMIIRPPKTATHTKGNLGFAKATNLGISLVETPYFTMCNDDVEFVNRKWWWGVMDTFKQVGEATPDRPAMMVNPASIRLPDWSVGRDKGDDFDIIEYKLKYSEEDYRHLVEDEHYVNEHLTLMPGSVIDGVTMYCSVFETDKFLEVGMLNEKFYPGGGEDYDYNCRANMHGYRCVGTTSSWVFHHWSKSFATIQEAEAVKALIDDKLRWNNNNELWGEGFDIWGAKDMKPEDVPPITNVPL